MWCTKTWNRKTAQTPYSATCLIFRSDLICINKSALLLPCSYHRHHHNRTGWRHHNFVYAHTHQPQPIINLFIQFGFYLRSFPFCNFSAPAAIFLVVARQQHENRVIFFSISILIGSDLFLFVCATVIYTWNKHKMEANINKHCVPRVRNSNRKVRVESR